MDDVTTDESRAKAAREWATKLAPLVDESITVETILDHVGIEDPEVIGLPTLDEPHRFGKYERERGNEQDGDGYFMLVTDLFGERVAWWESPPADMIKWITRKEAAAITGDSRERLRNYEYQMELHKQGHWDHYVGEPCPFNAQWTTWGSKHPDGIEYNRLYNARTKTLYAVERCPNCPKLFARPGHLGPNFDGTCQACGHQIVPRPDDLTAIIRKYGYTGEAGP